MEYRRHYPSVIIIPTTDAINDETLVGTTTAFPNEANLTEMACSGADRRQLWTNERTQISGQQLCAILRAHQN